MQKHRDLWAYLASSDKKIVMYGMGNGADKILSVCDDKKIEVCDFFASDGFVRGHSYRGKRVLSYSETKEKYGCDNMIVLLSFASSLPNVLANIYKIAEECELYAPDVPVCGNILFDHEFYCANKDKIDTVRDLLYDEKSREIFDDVVKYKLSGDTAYLRYHHWDADEIYGRLLGADRFENIADLGAYNGDTLREISPFAKNLKKAIAFEPDVRNFKKLCDYAGTVSDFSITSYQLAAWSEREALFFDAGGSRNSNLMTDPQLSTSKTKKATCTQADSLDNIATNAPLDFIKYDVEGAEMKAIQGSLNTIRRDLPALMISVYHRSEDIFELPLMVNKFFPEYKLYMRRREYVPAWDTVLIAVAKSVAK